MVAILMLSPEILAGTRVTLGRGSWLLQLPLLVHVAAGITGLLTGFLALSLVKGSEGHRRIGRVFVTAMIVMGAVGAAIISRELLADGPRTEHVRDSQSFPNMSPSRAHGK